MSEQRTRPTTFDLFILTLSLFSLVNIILLLVISSEQMRNVILIVEAFCSIAYLTDFSLRLHRAPTKSSYFFGQRGWLDLIGSLPFPLFRLARILRMLRVYRPLRRIGRKGIWRQAAADRAGSALLTAVFLTIVVIQYASMAILWSERNDPEANIHTASDAVWWSYVTITTVGYGDRYPVTNTGRFVGVALLSSGVGLFAVITGFLANAFLPRRRDFETSRSQVTFDEKVRELDGLIESLRSLSTTQSPTTEAESRTPGSANK